MNTPAPVSTPAAASAAEPECCAIEDSAIESWLVACWQMGSATNDLRTWRTIRHWLWGAQAVTEGEISAELLFLHAIAERYHADKVLERQA